MWMKKIARCYRCLKHFHYLNWALFGGFRVTKLLWWRKLMWESVCDLSTIPKETYQTLVCARHLSYPIYLSPPVWIPKVVGAKSPCLRMCRLATLIIISERKPFLNRLARPDNNTFDNVSFIRMLQFPSWPFSNKSLTIWIIFYIWIWQISHRTMNMLAL